MWQNFNYRVEVSNSSKKTVIRKRDKKILQRY